MNEKAREGKSRRSIFLTKRSRGQKVCSVIQGGIPRNSIDKDIRYERIKQMGGGKYLRKSYYHCIECSVANSLTTLIRKLYLNSSYQPYCYSP